MPDSVRCKAPTHYRVDLLAGLAYLELREGLGVAENTQVDPGSPVFAGDNISAFDQFNTFNRFYGGQIGIRSEYWWKRVFVDATGIVALGDTHQNVDISGATRITTPGGATTVLPGDLLAQSSNIGHYARDQFSVVPVLQLDIGYQLTRNLSVFAGYTGIFWTNVERPGDAISTAVNSTRVPTSTVAPTGAPNPPFNFRDSNFWAQGINMLSASNCDIETRKLYSVVSLSSEQEILARAPNPEQVVGGNGGDPPGVFVPMR